VPEDITKAPFIAGDTSAPKDDRLAALRKAFFAPNHDPAYGSTAGIPRLEGTARGRQGDSILGLLGERERTANRNHSHVRPFQGEAFWQELHSQFPNRVTTVVIEDAFQAVFPEQPAMVAEAVLPWLARYRGSAFWAANVH
jgi:hypothetical protein